jgi:hypothetical protein
MGGFIYTSDVSPTFGSVSADGQDRILSPSTVAEFHLMKGHFRLAPDAATVQFSYESNGAAPARFSLETRRLEIGADATGDLLPPITEAAGHPIEAVIRQDRRTASQYDSGRLVFSPHREKYIRLATTPLSLYGQSGETLWTATAPGFNSAVNISGDGKYAVMSFSDGTIRWYSMKDGKELLAFFPHADRKRWVMWTPAGYYDASPGAEGLIGWHVNNGKDAAADFFSVGQFRNVYYRPDVVSKVLALGDEQLALKRANDEAGRKQQKADVSQLLPPVVEIVSPADGAEVSSNEVTVRYQVRTPSGEPVTEVRALVDGRPANAERGIELKGSGLLASPVRELRATVPNGESQVSVIAANRFTTSAPANVRVRVMWN